MGSNWRRLVKGYKGKGLEDGNGIGGKGRLPNPRIEAIQISYGHINRGDKRDIPKMYANAWGIFGNVSSNIEKPFHNNCCKGPKNWCRYLLDFWKH